jgi:hypothetical protein
VPPLPELPSPSPVPALSVLPPSTRDPSTPFALPEEPDELPAAPAVLPAEPLVPPTEPVVAPPAAPRVPASSFPPQPEPTSASQKPRPRADARYLIVAFFSNANRGAASIELGRQNASPEVVTLCVAGATCYRATEVGTPPAEPPTVVGSFASCRSGLPSESSLPCRRGADSGRYRRKG